MPRSPCLCWGNIVISVFCLPARSLAEMQSQQNLVPSSPETGWSWLAASCFSYGNNLESWLAFAPWWPRNSKCSVISVHRFTYSQNKRSNRIRRLLAILTELFEGKAFLEALKLICHKALPLHVAHIKHKHVPKQLGWSVTATHRSSV